MSDLAKTAWKCECGHVLGYVQRTVREVRRLHVVVSGFEVAEIEGYSKIVCPACGKVRVWMPGKDALRELMNRCGKLEEFERLEAE